MLIQLGKIVVTGVAFLIALGCISTDALAGTIVGSKHDLAYLEDLHGIGNSYNDEVCIYCHTPHNADQSQGPLWNRPAPTVSYTLYASETLIELPGQPGPASLLCLSCHDGTIAVDTIIEMPNVNVIIDKNHPKMRYDPKNPGIMDCGTCHFEGAPGGNHVRSYFGTNLSNQHPVGIVYNTSTPRLRQPPAETVKLVNGKVECTSCHNVHDPEIEPFLITDNADSALCFACHAK